MLYQKENNEGFTLIEIIAVMGILGTSMRIAIPIYQGAQDKVIRTAARESLLQVKRECEMNNAFEIPTNFGEGSLKGYKLRSSGGNCNILLAVADNNEKHPTFAYDFSTDKFTCTYKNEGATAFPQCKKVDLLNTSSNKTDLAKIDDKNNTSGDTDLAKMYNEYKSNAKKFLKKLYPEAAKESIKNDAINEEKPKESFKEGQSKMVKTLHPNQTKTKEALKFSNIEIEKTSEKDQPNKEETLEQNIAKAIYLNPDTAALLQGTKCKDIVLDKYKKISSAKTQREQNSMEVDAIYWSSKCDALYNASIGLTALEKSASDAQRKAESLKKAFKEEAILLNVKRAEWEEREAARQAECASGPPKGLSASRTYLWAKRRGTSCLRIPLNPHTSKFEASLIETQNLAESLRISLAEKKDRIKFIQYCPPNPENKCFNRTEEVHAFGNGAPGPWMEGSQREIEIAKWELQLHKYKMAKARAKATNKEEAEKICGFDCYEKRYEGKVLGFSSECMSPINNKCEANILKKLEELREKDL